MSSGRYCFLCVSDEGVFLDVTTDTRDTFVDQLEICLSSKVNESIKLSNKICYKCAYELDQCTEFVQKYKKSHETSKPETLTPRCCLCFEHVKNNRIFDITKDTRSIFNPLQKIRKIFNEDIKQNNDSKLICLTCRYNLDVLYDLRRIYQEAFSNLKALINEEIDYSNFPKVYTDVVNRKTTITTFPDITVCDLINSDSGNSENMVRHSNMSHVKKRIGRPKKQRKARKIGQPKVRKCDECYNIVPNGTDMYRFHRTRLTVCRNCWITGKVDPSKDKLQLRSRQIESNLAETKLCTVFLTDVLDEKLYKSKKEYKIEKNKDNKLDDTSDDSSLEDKSLEDRVSESNSNITPKSENNAKQGKKRQMDVEKDEDIESIPTKVTRLSIKRANTNEAKVLSDVELSTRRGHKRTISDRSSDSDVSPLRSKKKLNDHTKLLSPSSNKSDRKKLRTILEGVTANVHSESTNESSTEDANFKGTTKNASNTNKERNNRKRRSISSTEVATFAEFKSPKSIASSEVEKNCYTCDTCGKKFDTKLANMEHSLTHLMQASLKLERVTILSIKEKQELKIESEEDILSIEEKQELKIDSKNREEIKICSSICSNISIEKHTDNSSEEVAINVVDTDDEEIFSLSTKNAKKKEEEKEASSEDNVTDDKLDAESEMCVEESTKIQSDEKITEESEQCVESMAVSSETIISIEIKQNEDTKETNKNIKEKGRKDKNTKNKDGKASTDRDIDTLKDIDTNVQKDAVVEDMSPTSKFLYKLCTNADIEKNKVSAENDTKVSTIGKEKSNNEINNDKEHLHEEMTHNSEAIRSLVSINNTTKNNHNHSESDVKNSCKNDESEVIKDIEMRQCNLTNKSSMENISESEEKEKTALNIIDEMETLKDQIDLDDTIIVDENKVETSEKQQDMANEQNSETEVIIDVDKPNSAIDTVELNILNDEKLNQMEDGDENESDVAIIPEDSNDIIQYTKDMEETTIVDNSKEKDMEETTIVDNSKDKLEETIKNLEDLIGNTNDTMNNKCEERENSNHIPNDSSIDAANMILKEVFDLAAAEVQKREDINNTKSLQDTEIESLENITREIRNSADMPSLDPISIMDIDDDNDITLN